MTRGYWLAVAERMIKTTVQAALALLGTNTIGVTDVDFAGLASAAALAALVSLLTSLGSISLAPGDGPAAFGPEKIEDEPPVWGTHRA